MGIGLVDPILPSIAQGLHATNSQVSLLFTSYFLITAVAMLVTGFVSSRIGGRKTLLAGLALVVVFAALSGTSGSVGELVGFRAGWGLGNALFVSTSLAVIVGAAAGGSAAAILLYESALGLGMACGPLLGAILGDMKWRYPFFGTAALMAIGFLAITAFLKEQPKPARKTSLLDPAQGARPRRPGLRRRLRVLLQLRVLHGAGLHPVRAEHVAVQVRWGLLRLGRAARGVLGDRGAPAPAPLRLAEGAGRLAAAARRRPARAGLRRPHHAPSSARSLSGAFIGLNNTVFTELALGVSDAPRPVASAGYNFVRWFAAAAAPFLAPKIEEWTDIHIPFVIAAAAAVAGAAVVALRRRALTLHAEEREPQHATEDGVPSSPTEADPRTRPPAVPHKETAPRPPPLPEGGRGAPP